MSDTRPDLFTLTQAILLSGLSSDCLRRYEKDGLISPKRSINGYRLYSHKDLETARQVYAARASRKGLTGTRLNLNAI